jgi:2',3'-cyclic-nucleotide 2'-phosphodiesterase (5'-nucleotidase family)
MQYKIFLILSLSVVFLNSCSFNRGGVNNEKLKGHWELYSQPDFEKSSTPSHVKRIIIASTNDIHGNILPHTERLTHGKKQIEIKVGGRKITQRYFKILKESYSGKVLLLDAGDSLNNQFDTKSKQLNLVEFIKGMDYDALSLGAKDFTTFKKGNSDLKSVIAQVNAPFITSNIIELKHGKRLTWKNTEPYLLKTVNGVKVGIIAVISPSIFKGLPKKNSKGFFFDIMEKSIIQNTSRLRRKGAQVIIAIVHAEQTCGKSIALEKSLPRDKVNFDPENSKACDLNGEVATMLKRLPPNMLDAVVTGKSHLKIANFIQDIPVIQAFSLGKYFSYIELYFDQNKKKVLKEKTKIHQPIKLCHEFIESTNDCYMNDQSVNIDKKIPAKFLNKTI